MWSVRAGNVMGTTRHHATLCYLHAEARTRLFPGVAAELRGAKADLSKTVDAAHSIAPLLLGRAQVRWCFYIFSFERMTEYSTNLIHHFK